MSTKTNDLLIDKAWDIATSVVDVSCPDEIVGKLANKAFECLMEIDDNSMSTAIATSHVRQFYIHNVLEKAPNNTHFLIEHAYQEDGDEKNEALKSFNLK
jgi:hypothetical protein